jgi:hypothetical protein
MALSGVVFFHVRKRRFNAYGLLYVHAGSIVGALAPAALYQPPGSVVGALASAPLYVPAGSVVGALAPAAL